MGEDAMEVQIAEHTTLIPLKFYDCIESCFESASSSWICADTCVNSVDTTRLHQCILLCLKHAEICATTARTILQGEKLSREVLAHQLRLCIESCKKTEAACKEVESIHGSCLISALSASECKRICEASLQELEIIS
jgi:hypothetical protein